MTQDDNAGRLQGLVRFLFVTVSGGFTLVGLLMSAFAFANLNHAKTTQNQTIEVIQGVKRLELSLSRLREELSEVRQCTQRQHQP